MSWRYLWAVLVFIFHLIIKIKSLMIHWNIVNPLYLRQYFQVLKWLLMWTFTIITVRHINIFRNESFTASITLILNILSFNESVLIVIIKFFKNIILRSPIKIFHLFIFNLRWCYLFNYKILSMALFLPHLMFLWHHSLNHLYICHLLFHYCFPILLNLFFNI